jgi:ATP-binding cassette subfamily F protein 3
MDWLRQYVPPGIKDVDEDFLRGFLGKMLFSGEEVLKKCNVLSGGEKVRCMISRMMMPGANLLVLDEPTNHLDIPAKQMLEDALMEYEGAALVVSHDRYFISRVANRIVELRDGELVLYRGDYAYYQQKKEEERLAAEELRLQRDLEAKRRANKDKQKAKASSGKLAAAGKG